MFWNNSGHDLHGGVRSVPADYCLATNIIYVAFIGSGSVNGHAKTFGD